MRRIPDPRTRASGQRGVSLIEAMVALVLLSVGLLGLAGLQARLLRSGSDAQYRVVAAALADRQLSMALVDPANVGCYQVPGAACSSAAAASATERWLLDVARLPAAAASASLITVPGGATGGNKQLRVQIVWRGHADALPHQVEGITDVR